MSILTRFVLLVCLHLVVRAWKNRQKSSNEKKRANYLQHRIGCEVWEGKVCDCGLEELVELEMEIHRDWSST